MSETPEATDDKRSRTAPRATMRRAVVPGVRCRSAMRRIVQGGPRAVTEHRLTHIRRAEQQVATASMPAPLRSSGVTVMPRHAQQCGGENLQFAICSEPRDGGCQPAGASMSFQPSSAVCGESSIRYLVPSGVASTPLDGLYVAAAGVSGV